MKHNLRLSLLEHILHFVQIAHIGDDAGHAILQPGKLKQAGVCGWLQAIASYDGPGVY